MIKRIHIHNFCCFENFELALEDRHSALLIGKNGSGKSTVRRALAVLQAIARGTSRVGELVKDRDFFLARADAPMRFELDVQLDGRSYQYRLALELPSGLRELQVQEEQFIVDGEAAYTRKAPLVTLTKQGKDSSFVMDLHTIALPIVHEQSDRDPLLRFKQWLARSVLLAPIPALIGGDSTGETLEPTHDGRNLGAWFAGMVAYAPSAYATMQEYLKENVLPDFHELRNPLVGTETRSLSVEFRKNGASFSLPIGALSDGEKCFFLCAMILAANRAYGPLFCFWDEPDSHLSLTEVGQFVMALRRGFEAGGQIIMTSHNPEAIRSFSDENTFILFRRSHLEPTRARLLADVEIRGDLIQALVTGDVEP